MVTKKVKRYETNKLQEDNIKTSLEKKVYTKPVLQELGDIRSLTLGASVAPYPESGGTFTFTSP